MKKHGWWLGAALLLSVEAAPPGRVPGMAHARLLGDAPSAEGVLTRIDNGLWFVGEGPGIPAGSILSVAFEGPASAPSQRPEIVFPNGDRLRASVKGASLKGEKELLQLETAHGGAVELDLEKIQAVLYWSRLGGLPADERARILEKALAEKPDFERDLLAVDLGGGTVDLDGSGYLTGQILTTGSVPRSVPDPDDAHNVLEIQAGIVAARIKFPIEPAGLAGGTAPTAVLALADGGLLTGRATGVSEREIFKDRTERFIAFETVHGFALELPLAAVRQVDLLHAGLAHLSDLDPASTEFRRFTGGTVAADDRLWPHLAKDRPAAPGESRADVLRLGGRTYRKGLGTHAYCKAAYDLPPGYARFVADVGIDAHVAQESNPDAAGIVARVWGDGKLLYESPLLTVRSQPALVSVPVAGVKTLVLETDWGTKKDLETLLAANPPPPADDFLRQTDMLDRACWGHAVLVK